MKMRGKKMNEKVPLEQAKVFRAVDPETSYSAYNAEKLVTFKLINGLAQVIPVTVVAKDLMAMMPLINGESSTEQKVEDVEKTSFWASVQNSTTMTEPNQRDFEGTTDSVDSEKTDDKSQDTESEAEDTETNTLGEVDEKSDENDQVDQVTEPVEPTTSAEETETPVSGAATGTPNTTSSEDSADSGSGRANPDDLLGFETSNEDDNLDEMDRQASEDLAKAAKQQNDAIVDKRAEEILAERQAYVDNAKIDNQVIEDLNKQKTRTADERRAEHQKWAEEALNNTKTRTIG